MNPINFLNTPSLKHRNALARWYTWTALSCCIIVAGLSIMYLLQYHTFKNIQQEIDLLQKHSQRLAQKRGDTQSLVQQEQELSKKIKHLSLLKTQQQKMINFFAVIEKVANAHLKINSLSLSGKEFEIAVQCTNPTTAVSTLNLLKKSFKTMRLTNLQMNKNNQAMPFTAFFKGDAQEAAQTIL